MKSLFKLFFCSLFLMMSCICQGETHAQNDNDSQHFVWEAGRPLGVCYPSDVPPVVQSALEMLRQDAQQVLGSDIYPCTQGKASMVLNIVPDGRWEGFTMQVNTERQLVITGSDAHGLAYGILEVSRIMGVSPWCWWADVVPAHKERLMLPIGYLQSDAPDVAFRGIFINDEDWGLMPWGSMTIDQNAESGRIGPRTYQHVFELLLRLRANTIWPAMHEVTYPFFLTPGNREMAARYGIYMGGSHCEPMACSAAREWGIRGEGQYDYVNNAENVRRFWEQRLKEVKDQEVLYTIGMRGVHDGAMQGAKTIEEQKAVLTRVISDQREMLERYIGGDGRRSAAAIPQVFIPYKEVLDVYDAGLQVPDDVCLMWCDDNYGYIRHFPTEAERARKGGNGIYYHVSYWGRPHDYLWLGSQSPALMMQQMQLAYDKGIQQIWILNVGDIKPLEYQTELFLDMAWDMKRVRTLGLKGHQREFYEREFGKVVGSDIQQMMQEWWRLAWIHKPEFMGGTRTEESDRKYWHTVRDLPWSNSYIAERLKDYARLSDRAIRIAPHIAQERRDAYFHLVKYPVLAADQMNRKLLTAQLARRAGGDEALWAQSDAAFDSIASLTRVYNEGIDNAGKWTRMMDMQPRRLPDFAPVPHTVGEAMAADKAATERWKGRDAMLKHWDGADATSGDYVRCEGLGYHEGAIGLLPGKAVSYLLPKADADSITVELHLLPTHAVEGERLRLNAGTDDNAPAVVEYRTEGRSEEWKENVLWNQSVKRVTLPCTQGQQCVISLTTDCEGVVLDEILVIAKAD